MRIIRDPTSGFDMRTEGEVSDRATCQRGVQTDPVTGTHPKKVTFFLLALHTNFFHNVFAESVVKILTKISKMAFWKMLGVQKIFPQRFAPGKDPSTRLFRWGSVLPHPLWTGGGSTPLPAFMSNPAFPPSFKVRQIPTTAPKCQVSGTGLWVVWTVCFRKRSVSNDIVLLGPSFRGC